MTVLTGIDPGIGRQAAVVFAYLDFDGTLIVFDEIALAGANVGQICAEYHRRCERWRIRPRFNVIDPSARNRDMVTGKALREEYTKHGVVTILGQNSYELGFNIGKERFERTPPGILITADCPELVRQLGRYRWRSDPRSPEGTPASGPIKQDDHLCDALRYLWCSPMVTPKRPPVEESATMKDRLMREHLKHLQRPRVQHPAGPGVFA